MRVIKFEKSDCQPCKRVSEFFKSKNFLSYEKVDIMEDLILTDTFQIMSVPVVVVLDDNGDEIFRTHGYKPSELEEVISIIQKS